MLNMVPKKSKYIFNSNPRGFETYFLSLRKRLAQRLRNPRLRENLFPHDQALESNTAIPPNKRHSIHQREPRTQRI